MEDRHRPKIHKTDEDWAKELSPEQFHITRRHGTERAFTGPWLDNKAPGTYACVCCGRPLFDAGTKYESGSGWPSFYQPVDPEAIAMFEDNSLAMTRVEIRCADCDAHLGHVFPDGPEPTGLRYCTNGAALSFRPKDQ